jgi:hypothetical protein
MTEDLLRRLRVSAVLTAVPLVVVVAAVAAVVRVVRAVAVLAHVQVAARGPHHRTAVLAGR